MAKNDLYRQFNLRSTIHTARQDILADQPIAKGSLHFDSAMFYLKRLDRRYTDLAKLAAEYEPTFAGNRKNRGDQAIAAIEKQRREETAKRVDPAQMNAELSSRGNAIFQERGIDPAAIAAELEQTEAVELVKTQDALKQFFESPEFLAIVENDKSLSRKYYVQSIQDHFVSMANNKRSIDIILDSEYFPKAARQTVSDMDYVGKKQAEIGAKIYGIVDDMIASSSVSESEAMEYAIFVDIDKTATSALNRGSTRYKNQAGEAQLVRDLADHYRLIGGMAHINGFYKEPKNPRAHYQNKGRLINVGKNLTKTTLWHELSHAIEYQNPEILQACKGFLLERLAEPNEGIVSLRKFYRTKQYDSDEIALIDHCFDHYVSKIYLTDEFKKSNYISLPASGSFAETMINNIRSSEVVTMGIQCLSSPKLCAEFVKKDPRHAAFIVGLLEKLNKQ